MTSSTLEATDRQILQLLAADGRMSFTDLGKATGLSTSAVHQRVKRLEQRGLILGYGATVNHDEIGLPLTAFISIRPIDPSQPDDSPARLEEIPEIESCWSVAGDESYILKVRLARPATSRSCWPASGPPPTSRPAPPSCCRPTTRTDPSPAAERRLPSVRVSTSAAITCGRVASARVELAVTDLSGQRVRRRRTTTPVVRWDVALA